MYSKIRCLSNIKEETTVMKNYEMNFYDKTISNWFIPIEIVEKYFEE